QRVRHDRSGRADGHSFLYDRSRARERVAGRSTDQAATCGNDFAIVSLDLRLGLDRGIVLRAERRRRETERNDACRNDTAHESVLLYTSAAFLRVLTEGVQTARHSDSLALVNSQIHLRPSQRPTPDCAIPRPYTDSGNRAGARTSP